MHLLLAVTLLLRADIPAEKLVQTLQTDKVFAKRQRAVMALIRRHDITALPALKKAVQAPDPMTRTLACLALSGYPANFAYPLLDLADQDSVPLVRKAAAAARSDIKADQERVAAAPPPPSRPPPEPVVARPITPVSPKTEVVYTAPSAKSGPRLDVHKMATIKSPDGLALLTAPQELSLAAANAAPGWWIGDASRSQENASYVLNGKAKWSNERTSRGEKVKVRVEGSIEKPNRQLLGSVGADASIDVPNGVTPEDRAAAIRQGWRHAMTALVGDITDVVNVDRQNSGESLLR